MDPAAVLAALGPIHIHLIAAAVAMARMMAMIVVFPAFTRLGLTGFLRAVVALALSIPMVPMIAAALSNHQLTLGVTGMLMLKEAAVGLAVGLVAGAPIWAAQFAGDFIDTQRGATSGLLTDPSTVQATASGTLFILAMLALYFGSGGLAVTVGVVYESYGIWPVDRLIPLFGADAWRLLLASLDHIVNAGVSLAGPIVGALLLTDLIFGLAARIAPQLQAYSLAQGAKNLLFAFLILIYFAFLIEYMGRDLAGLRYVAAPLAEFGAAPGR
jgi:type III secretion protein T